jgi:hypothetical protein
LLAVFDPVLVNVARGMQAARPVYDAPMTALWAASAENWTPSPASV